MAPLDRSSKVATVLARRLHELAQDTKKIPALVKVDAGFSSSTLPSFSAPRSFDHTPFQFTITRDSKCLFVSELFDLIASQKAMEFPIDDIRAIRTAMLTKATEGWVKLAKNPFAKEDERNASRLRTEFSREKLVISWPESVVSSNSFQIISQQEFLAMVICNQAERLLPQAESQELQAAQLTEIQDQWIAAKFQSLDTNHDGFLSREEGSLDSFDAIDSNLDMRVSLDELLAFSIANDFPRRVLQGGGRR